MTRFILSLATFALLVAAADRALGRLLRQMFDSPGNAEVDDLTAAARRRPQIVISGSSRARNHYVADSMERVLARRVHTFGRGGQFSSVYQYVVAQLVLAESVPEVWVIEADARLYRGRDADKLAELLPYANRSEAIREALSTRSRFERVKLWSRAYPYNSLALNLAKAHVSPIVAVPRNGFNAARGRIEPGDRLEPLDAEAFFPPVDRVKLAYLRRLVSDLRAHGVRVLAVRSPFYGGDAKTRSLLDREGRELSELFASMHVPVLDVSPARFPQFASAASYADRRHLNEEAALRFSRLIADSINELAARPPQLVQAARPGAVSQRAVTPR